MSLPAGQRYPSTAEAAAREAAKAKARGLKAYDLMRAFRAELVKVAPYIDPMTEAGAKAVLQMAVAAPERIWDATAEAHGIRKPSTDTIDLAIAMLRSWSQEAGKDPFEAFGV